ncbi:MAG: RND family transporter [Methanomassiliicoccales archaeon]|nr:RND family transporter [Methanomassiliicoccales archaeon]NYT15151.1 RND family transporter [Methanomassiliicoccales archaeon]
MGDRISKRPRTAILIVVFITLLSIFSVAYNGLNTDFDFENFMPENEVSDATTEIQQTFASAYSVVLLVKDDGGDVITQDNFINILETEKAIYEDQNISQHLVDPTNPANSVISPVDIIATSILYSMDPTTMSMLNITPIPTYDNLIKVMQVTSTENLKIAVYGILNNPLTPDQLKAAIERFMTSDFNSTSMSPSAQGMMILYNFNKEDIGKDKNTTALQLELDMQTKIDNTGELAGIFVIGTALISNDINDAANESIMILFPIALAAIVIILILIYRDIGDTLVGLLGLVIAIVWMYGFGALLGYSFNPMTMIVPILILGLGIDYSIHLIMRYREERMGGKGIEKGVSNTIIFVGEALLLATITTMIAFLSNLTSPLQPISEFGVLAAVGIFSSFVAMILLIPGVKILRDRRKEAKGKISERYIKKKMNGYSMEGINSLSGQAAKRHPWGVVAVALIITIGLGIGATQVETTFDMNDFLPENMETSQNIRFFTNEFNNTGEATANVLIKGGVTDPEAVRSMEIAIENMADDENVLKTGGQPDVNSFLSVMYDWATNSSGEGFIDQRYNETFSLVYHQYFTVSNNTGFIKNDTTQDDVEMLVGWLFFNAPMDMVQVLMPNDDGYSALMDISITSQMSSDDTMALYNNLMDDTQSIRDMGLYAQVTGETIMTELIISDMDKSQMTSLITTLIASLIILTIVMYAFSRSFVLGAVSILPVVLCVVWMWGIMFIFGIPLNVMTLTIASLTVGMGVTYGIHITHRFVEEFKRNGDIDNAVNKAVGKTGVSLLGAALTTIVGFGIIGFSILPPLQQFGVITALAIGLSFIGAVFVLPAILVIWARTKQKNRA